MGSASEALKAYMEAVSNPGGASAAALEPFLAQEASVTGILGGGRDRASVLAALSAPNAPKLLTAATWGEPREEGGETIVEAMLPPGSVFAGMVMAVRLDGEGRIEHVGQQVVPAAPPSIQPIVITDEMKALIDGALANGTPIMVSYVDAENAPHLSLRGSVQAFGQDRLAIWVRDPEGGILKGIAANPKVALFYRDPKMRTTYTFTGRARIATDAATRDAVYENTPDIERNLDGRKRGVAVVVDLDAIDGAGPGGRVRMRRE